MQEHTRCHFEWERGRGKEEGIEGKNRVSCLEHSLLLESPDDLCLVLGTYHALVINLLYDNTTFLS